MTWQVSFNEGLHNCLKINVKVGWEAKIGSMDRRCLMVVICTNSSDSDWVPPGHCPGPHLAGWRPTASAWRRARPRCPPWWGPGPPSSSPPAAAPGTGSRTRPGPRGRRAAQCCPPAAPSSVSGVTSVVSCHWPLSRMLDSTDGDRASNYHLCCDL